MSEKQIRRRARLFGVFSFALVLVATVMLAASCGNSENGPPIASWSSEPVIKIPSGLSFTKGIVDDGEGDFGQYSPLAIDPDDNNPAVAYYDATNHGLKYAKYNGSSWDAAVVDDPELLPVVDVGLFPSLAFDGSGNPSIGYYDFTNGALKWAYDEDEDGVWNEDGWPMVVADGENKDYGKHCSHKISGNAAGFAFFEENDNDLIYLQINLTTMQTSMVEPDTTNDVGQYCSLHFHGGQPTISYLDATASNLKYAKYNGSTWDVEVVDDGVGHDVGKFSNLDYDSSGNASIVYYDETAVKPLWIRWDSNEEEWYYEDIDVPQSLDCGSDISHEWYSGVCGIAFEAEGESDDYLRFVRWTSVGQTSHVVDDTEDCGNYTSTAWVRAGDYAGDVWISHHDFNLDDIRWARGRWQEE